MSQASGGASPPGRFSLDLRQAGHGCTLVISGSYDEVLNEGVEHEFKAHGRDNQDRLRAMVLTLMKPEQIDWLWPEGAEGLAAPPARWPG